MLAAILVVLVFFIYVVDWCICTIYCKAKKKRDSIELATKECLETAENTEEKCNVEHNTGFGWKIKQLLNGYMMYSVARLGRIPCQNYRRFKLKHVYQMQLGKNVVIYGDFRIRAPWNIIIGDGTIIGDGCSLDGRNGLYIGSNVNLSTGVYIYTEQHEVNDPFFASGKSGGSVKIGDRAWLSSRTTVLPKVQIGEGAVLASGALTPKDLDAFGIYAGVPAKKIGERNQDLKYEFDGSALPFY